MNRRSRELGSATEWVLPLGVCCAEAQADGVPCAVLGRDCLRCDRAEPVREILLRLARFEFETARQDAGEELGRPALRAPRGWIQGGATVA